LPRDQSQLVARIVGQPRRPHKPPTGATTPIFVGITVSIARIPECAQPTLSGEDRMGATLTLVDLAGAVALLIWGVHMVQTGITRAFGLQLRRVLSRALGNRLESFAAGIGVTAILQSS